MTAPLNDRSRRAATHPRASILAAASVVIVVVAGAAFVANRSWTTTGRPVVAVGSDSTSRPGGAGVETPRSGAATSTPTSVTALSQSHRHPPAPPSTVAVAPTTASIAPGPTSEATTVASGRSQVRGTVLFGPVCPVERIPPDPACAPRPGAAEIQLLRSDGTVASQGMAGASGQFVVAVAPGTYLVKADAIAAPPVIGRGCSVTPSSVTVKAGAMSIVAVSCDTGIR